MIRKAVFPVAGLGTRMLPATKAMPKEMLPVVDKPIIQYAFEEARAAGIEQFIFVTGRGKSSIDDHFDHSYELDDTLEMKGKTAERASVAEWLPKPGQVSYTRSKSRLALVTPSGAHATWWGTSLLPSCWWMSSCRAIRPALRKWSTCTRKPGAMWFR